MKKEIQPKDNSQANIHTLREAWLRAATDELRPDFAKRGYVLPDNIRSTIAFPSGGKRGAEGECWHPESSRDRYYNIFIKADNDDPLIILGILTRELIHTLLPSTVKYGKEFRDIALRIGLDGKMMQATPAPALLERLKVIATNLGPIPYGKLDFTTRANSRRKASVRMLKAECTAVGCGFNLRILPKWAKAAALPCPMNPKHGILRCEIPDDDGDGDESHDYSNDAPLNIGDKNTHSNVAKRHSSNPPSNNKRTTTDINVSENQSDDILPDALITKNEYAVIISQQQSPHSANRYDKLQQKHDE